MLLPVASVGLRVGRAFSLTAPSSANAAAAPAQPRCRRPRRQDLHANKKEKGRGPGRAGAPYARQGARLPQPSAKGLLLAGFSRDPWFSPDPTTAVRTPSQPSLK